MRYNIPAPTTYTEEPRMMYTSVRECTKLSLIGMEEAESKPSNLSLSTAIYSYCKLLGSIVLLWYVSLALRMLDLAHPSSGAWPWEKIIQVTPCHGDVVSSENISSNRTLKVDQLIHWSDTPPSYIRNRALCIASVVVAHWKLCGIPIIRWHGLLPRNFHGWHSDPMRRAR